MTQTIKRGDIEAMPKAKTISGEKCYKDLSANGKYLVYKTKERYTNTLRGRQSLGCKTMERYEITD